MRKLLALGALALATIGGAQTVTFLHSNDIHARIEPTVIKGKPYGGYARLVTLVRELKAMEENPVVLDAGDVFQGTLFFTVYQGLADLLFLRMMGVQAMAVGNHEFDLGPAPLAAFARSADFPLLACNLDLSQEPTLKDLVKPFVTIQAGDQTIGIVGAVTADLPTISAPGPTVRMLDLDDSIRKAVDALALQGVSRIVLLSHVGYREDQRIARSIPGIDVIIGGHSHTRLGEVANPDLPGPDGPYPTVIRQGGRTILVATSWEWGKIYGRQRVTFDDKGEVASWSDAPPIPVDESIRPDPAALATIAALARPVAQLRAEVVGETSTGLDASREVVRSGESTMANVICDAMLDGAKMAKPDLALMNGGGVRASIEPGPITFEEAIMVQPFGNTIVVLELTGKELLAALEHGVSQWEQGRGGFLHVSRGTKITIDVGKPASERVVKATLNDQAIDPARVYRVVLNSFTAAGGDGHETIKNAPGRRLDIGFVDVDLLVAYLKANRPTDRKPEGRITVIGKP
jgi:5'-nucleotidase